ncbi:invasin domain 3-containing protein [Serratia symbiotica]|uniref:invasin domain 3-containing protein n=1 Tax=Serratia symbiotica TaxID=138074 RepID=UPI0024E21C0C|nr:invasin domain 3-containing protein [Serratia symbiotica]
MRSLAGSRYDLVACNNNILLEYHHQQQVIHLQTAEQVSGYTGEQKSLGVSVTSKYGLAHIEWTAPTLLASGSKIVQVGADYSVVLPPYQKVGREINTYLLSGVAADTRGNRTERSEIRVTVLAPVITESHAAQENSAITRDQDNYVAGREMMVTVTLKDAQGNPVSGQAAALTNDSVQVAKATAWTDAGNGTYTRTYTTQQAGSALKATLQLPDWNSADESATYAISAGEAAQANSAIARDKDSYVAGSEMMLTVTLKDAQGNPVIGQASALTDDRVQVANAAAKATAWTDVGNGTYTRTYTAQQAGSALKATLQLPDWNSADESAAYTISAGEATQANSAITRDQDSYLTDDEMMLTLTLKDAQGNPVSGQASALTDDRVQVANAAAKAEAWTDAGNGIYTCTYTAQQAGSDLKATLQLPGWRSANSSPAYTITINGYLKDIAVNGYTFNKDAGFPTTGFKGAKFTLELNDGNQAPNYTWASDTSWVTVNDGVVAFTNTGTGKKVTITGTPKSGKGNVITYNFTLNSWFINDKEIEMTWADAKRYCSSQSGYSLATVQQLNGNPDHRRGNRGVMGGLWGEWGDLTNYSGADF